MVQQDHMGILDELQAKTMRIDNAQAVHRMEERRTRPTQAHGATQKHNTPEVTTRNRSSDPGQSFAQVTKTLAPNRAQPKKASRPPADREATRDTGTFKTDNECNQIKSGKRRSCDNSNDNTRTKENHVSLQC